MTLALTALILAQATAPYADFTFVNPLPQALEPKVYAKVWQRTVERRSKVKPALLEAKRAPLTATDFVASPQTTGAAQRLVESSKGLSPEHQKVLLLGIDVGTGAYEAAVRKHNVAWAMGFLLSAAFDAAYGKELADAELDAVVRDANDVLALDPAFKKLKTPQRQKLYETCLATAVLLGSMVEAADDAKDDGLRKKAQLIGDDVLGVFQAGSKRH